ncbi:MAG: DUF262 domain-containing protein [Thiotrichales bacterium]
MTNNEFTALFSGSANTPELITVRDLVGWVQAERLLLAPIQRSAVWTNEQIVNYWDSLLRGYPAGMMMVQRAGQRDNATESKGRDFDGKTGSARKDDFLLFDGQQRTAAILLGLERGAVSRTRKLWVDLGVDLENDSSNSAGIKFQLRLTSTGQPFGYKPNAPNEKVALDKRQKKWEEWRGRKGDKALPEKAFEEAVGGDLIDASCAVAFSEVFEFLEKNGPRDTVDRFRGECGAKPDVVENFVNALSRALDIKIIISLVDQALVGKPEEYIRFFTRLGQGGTRLSDDELTYSIIKQQYPEVHDRMREIVKGKAGRLASEVDLVLAALRVAKTLAPWVNAKDWEVTSRPTPTFVNQLRRQEMDCVRSKFYELVGLGGQKGLLAKALMRTRENLSYSAEEHPEGLPSILLAHLPRDLVDSLILIMVTRGVDKPWSEYDRAILRAFVLHWLHFVVDGGKAAGQVFAHGTGAKVLFGASLLRKLVEEYESERVAHFVPRPEHLQATLEKLREEIRGGDYNLRSWDNRFTAADGDSEMKPGKALRFLSTDSDLIKRALMWLQRRYIAEQFPNYDPTSDRDEDLPIDLDHLVPSYKFRFDWRSAHSRLPEKAVSDNFRWGRQLVGDSLGNYRWLAVSDNRKRRESELVPLPNGGDLVAESEAWNEVIRQQPWTTCHVASFQRLIDLRTIELYEKLVTESGIADMLAVATQT